MPFSLNWSGPGWVFSVNIPSRSSSTNADGKEIKVKAEPRLSRTALYAREGFYEDGEGPPSKGTSSEAPSAEGALSEGSSSSSR